MINGCYNAMLIIPQRTERLLGLQTQVWTSTEWYSGGNHLTIQWTIASINPVLEWFQLDTLAPFLFAIFDALQ